MSNSSLLLNLNSSSLDDPEDCWDFAVMEGHNHIPNFWFSAFQRSDITTITLDDELYPHCVTDSRSAVANVRLRKDSILSILPIDRHTLYEQWVSLIEGVEADYLHINLIEMADMVGPDETRAECLAYIKSLDGEDLAELKKQYSFIGSSTYPDEVIPGMLMGYPLDTHT